jgi:hypothetical protein
VLLICEITYPIPCSSKSCRTAYLFSILQRCSDITNILLQVEIDGGLIEFVLQFLQFTLTSMKHNESFL